MIQITSEYLNQHFLLLFNFPSICFSFLIHPFLTPLVTSSPISLGYWIEFKWVKMLFWVTLNIVWKPQWSKILIYFISWQIAWESSAELSKNQYFLWTFFLLKGLEIKAAILAFSLDVLLGMFSYHLGIGAVLI